MFILFVYSGIGLLNKNGITKSSMKAIGELLQSNTILTALNIWYVFFPFLLSILKKIY